MKYIKKTNIVEAIKWDGKLETIENNKWLEDALKNEEIIVAVDKLTDKEALLLIKCYKEYMKVDVGVYIIKESTIEGYELDTMKADEFEIRYESVDKFISNLK